LFLIELTKSLELLIATLVKLKAFSDGDKKFVCREWYSLSNTLMNVKEKEDYVQFVFVKEFSRFISRSSIKRIIREYFTGTTFTTTAPKKKGAPFQVNTESNIQRIEASLEETNGNQSIVSLSGELNIKRTS